MEYAELNITSNFSFLRGGSHPEELTGYAAKLGYKAIAVTDRNTLAGIVRAHVAAKSAGIRFIPACRLDLQDGPPYWLIPLLKQLIPAFPLCLRKATCGQKKGNAICIWQM